MIGNKFSKRKFLSLSFLTTTKCAVDRRNIPTSVSEIKNKKRRHNVVIGSGLGGLCCGALLARSGYPVTIIEQHAHHGGYASAFERMDGKFYFEVSLHGSSLRRNEAARILEKLGVMEKLQLVELPEVLIVKTPEWQYSVPQKNAEKFIGILADRFPEEAAGIDGYIRETLAIEQEIDHYNRQKNGRSVIRKILFPFLYPNLWKIRNKTLHEHLKGFVSDPECAAALSCLWAYYGLPPSKLSAFYYAIATGGYLRNGSYYIKDRSETLSNLLAETVKKSGGTIIYNAKADAIAIDDDRVSGVVLSNGKFLEAGAVAANCSVPTIFEKMIPARAVPNKYIKKLKRCKPSISSFIVWLGLKESLLGSIDGYAFHIQGAKSPEIDYENCLKGRVDRGYYTITIYDNAFEGYSALGSSTLMLFFPCGYEPWEKFEQDYWRENKADYNKQKEEWKKILIKRAERDLIAGLSKMIEISEAATPLTNWRYTGNPQGAIYGYEQSIDNSFMKRLSEKTPIKGLFLASAWANPGGGYVGALQAGGAAFEALVRYRKNSRYDE